MKKINQTWLTKSLTLALAMIMALSLQSVLAETSPDVTQAEVTQDTATQAASVAVEPPAENVFLTNPILDMFEEDFDLSTLEGKVLMLNFWATWCPPCIAEMPELSELAVQYADKIALLGILSSGVRDVAQDGTIIADQDELTLAREYYEKAGISYPSLIPNRLMLAVQQQLQMQSIPTTLFVNPQGVIVEKIVGARDKADWEDIIGKVLETPRELFKAQGFPDWEDIIGKVLETVETDGE